MSNEIEKENGNYELKLSEIKEETKSVISKKELHSYILFVINQFIWGFQGLQLKSFFYFFSKDYDINSFVFYRHLGLCIAGYLSIRYKNITLNFPWQIYHRIWFYIRNISIIYLSNIRWSRSFINNTFFCSFFKRKILYGLCLWYLYMFHRFGNDNIKRKKIRRK